MIGTHIGTEAWTRYSRREMQGGELLAFSEHLASCSECRARSVAAAMGEAAELRRAVMEETVEHPDYEAVERFVERKSDATEADLIAHHIAWCTRCAGEVENLHVFVSEMAPWPMRLTRSHPWAIAAMVTVVVGASLLMTPGLPWNRSEQRTPLRVELHDGSRTIWVDARGSIHGAPEGWEEAIRSALVTTPVSTQHTGTFAPDALRGTAAESGLRVVSPVGTIVLDDQPRFEWHSGDPAAKFAVQVVDSQFREIASSGLLTKPSWQPPRPLPRGKKLLWQVTETSGAHRVTSPQPPEQPAEFTIVDAASAARIDAAQRGGSHLDLAVSYARAGMQADAQRELDVFARINPRSPVVARILQAAQTQRSR